MQRFLEQAPEGLKTLTAPEGTQCHLLAVNQNCGFESRKRLDDSNLLPH